MFLLTNYLNVSAFGWKLPFQFYPVMWGKTLFVSLICCIISIALPTFLMFKNSTALMVKDIKMNVKSFLIVVFFTPLKCWSCPNL